MQPNRLRRIARTEARHYGLDPTLFERQIGAESNFNPRAVSGKNARGVAQIVPSTARAWGVNPDDPRQALGAAAKHMADYVRKYGSYENALRAYNAGPGAIAASRKYPETNAYVRKILQGGKGQTQLGGGAAGPAASAGPIRLGKVGSIAGILQALSGEERTDSTQALLDYFRQRGRPGSLLALRSALGGGGERGQTILDELAKPIARQPRLSAITGGSSASSTPATGARGTTNFEGKRVAAWIAPELRYARAHGWKGQVESGFRSRAEQTRIYNSGVRPAAKPGTSNHEGANFPRGAVDVSDAAQLARILRRKRSPLRWAGAKDPVHFSHPHGGSY